MGGIVLRDEAGCRFGGNMKGVMKNFGGSLVFTIICLALAGWIGWSQGGLQIAVQLIFIAAVLGVMETSLSLDNAVVNATVLKDMDPVWQRRFLTWGILIAVFGMRIVFPLAIVSIAGWISPWAALDIALTDRDQYQQIVTGAHIGISGFGGAFLLLVGLNFFLSGEKEHHWIPFLEKPAAALSSIPFGPYVAALVITGAVSFLCPPEQQVSFLIAAVSGIAVYFGVQLLGDIMSSKDEAGQVVRSGAAGFVYLEFLDASFSFDGVIGAFAITNDILIIALGLGIGAMFVRSMTIFLVRGGHLAEYRYLEHGAFWAIVALAAIMLLSVRFHIPEVVTGLIGAMLIAAAWRTSVVHRQRHPEDYPDENACEGARPDGTIGKPN